MLDRAPWTSDASEREQVATAAIAIARRYGDRDLEFDAMALLGDAYVASGRVAEGMSLLDQAMTAVAAGEVRGLGPVGEIYGRLLSACERATDVRRAEQWLEAAIRFEAWGDFVPLQRRSHRRRLVAPIRFSAALTRVGLVIDDPNSAPKLDRHRDVPTLTAHLASILRAP